MTQGRAKEFVNKRNAKIKRADNKYILLGNGDYKNDFIPNTVYSLNDIFQYILISHSARNLLEQIWKNETQ
jgi:hypothetical protein